MDPEIENSSTQLEYVLEGVEQDFVLGTDLADEILRTNEEFPTQVPVLYTVGLKSYSFFNTHIQTPEVKLPILNQKSILWFLIFLLTVILTNILGQKL